MEGKKLRHGSLFSGIGGFDLAAEWMGWENVFHCEWEKFPRNVLHHYWPDAISYGDITKTDFKKHEGTIDIISGGFPCQPYSQAGKRLGKEDNRHLWPEMLRTIREVKPRWVVGENVFGIVNWNEGLVFEEVQTDLEFEGYEVQTYVLPAAGVNAPHQRYRTWFIAYSDHGDDRRTSGQNARSCKEERLSERNEIRQPVKSSEVQRPTSDTDNARAKFRMRTNRNGQEENKGRQRQSQFEHRADGSNGTTSDTKRIRPSRQEHRQKESGQLTETYKGSRWQNFPTQSPICSRNDGISDRLDGITFPKWRNESIKAYGNAVVPQVVYQIFQSIQQYEDGR